MCHRLDGIPGLVFPMTFREASVQTCVLNSSERTAITTFVTFILNNSMCPWHILQILLHTIFALHKVQHYFLSQLEKFYSTM